MISSRSRVVFSASFIALLSGCGATLPTTQAGICDTVSSGQLLGKEKPTNLQASRLTGARIVRQIDMDWEVVKDFRADRVTIETDPSSGKVVNVTCG
jgi:hypothetical protein